MPKHDVRHFALVIPDSGSAPPESWITCPSAFYADAYAQCIKGIAYEAHPVVDATGAEVHRMEGPELRIAELERVLDKTRQDLEEARRDALVLAYTVALEDGSSDLDPGARSALMGNVLDKEGELYAAVERAAQQVGWKRQDEDAL